MTDFIQTVSKLIAPLKRRVLLMVGRCVLKASYDDETLQLLQLTLLANEVRDKVERIQEYGFTSRPLAGAEGVCVFPGGDRSHGVVIATDDRRYRKNNLDEGDVALYSDLGDYLWFKRSRELHTRANKFKFQGSSDELVDLVVQLAAQVENIADKLSMDTTNTVLGPMKLNGFAYYAARKTDVTSIKGKIDAMKAS